MSGLPHPSRFIDPEVLTFIRHHAAEAEERRQLHEEQLKLIYSHKWFKMFVPRNYGGLELTLPQVLKIEEALAWADGSTAWVVTLCSGAGWFIGFLDAGLSDEIFLNDNVCVAGSGAPTGTAEISTGGYVINGEWRYASGSLNATMFTANCMIKKDGVSLPDHDGKPQIKSFIFFPEEVSIKTTWNSMGMMATASHTFVIRDLVVPENRAFVIDRKHATLPDRIYQYPFLQLAETTLVVNIAGMAQQFLDLAREVFAQRMSEDQTKKDLMNLHRQSQAALQARRNEFYRIVERSWSLCERGREIPDAIIAEVSNVSHQLYATCMSEVNALYRHTGLLAANMQSEINRVWRNIHTASQHSLFFRVASDN